MGVLSNRVDLKVAAAIAERQLERWAEPLAALWLPKEHWPAGLLDDAWLALVRNSAHDSVCGCSADAVGRAVRHRYDVATALAGEVIDQALALAELATDTPGPMVINPGRCPPTPPSRWCCPAPIRSRTPRCWPAYRPASRSAPGRGPTSAGSSES